MRIRPARMRAARMLALLLLAALVWGGQLSAEAARAHVPHRSEPWREMFQLQPGTTYTYTLREVRDEGRGPGRGERERTVGELNVWKPAANSDEIHFWYTVGRLSGRGVAPNDPRGLVGALLLSALVRPDPVDVDALRLLATPLMWATWYDEFAGAEFHDGVVWEINQHPPVRFTVTRQAAGVYAGDVTVGRETVLELRISLSEPLPLSVVSHAGRTTYRAELKTSRGRPILR